MRTWGEIRPTGSINNTIAVRDHVRSPVHLISLRQDRIRLRELSSEHNYTGCLLIPVENVAALYTTKQALLLICLNSLVVRIA